MYTALKFFFNFQTPIFAYFFSHNKILKNIEKKNANHTKIILISENVEWETKHLKADGYNKLHDFVHLLKGNRIVHVSGVLIYLSYWLMFL